MNFPNESSEFRTARNALLGSEDDASFRGLGRQSRRRGASADRTCYAFARDKGWKHTRLVSAAHNTFRRDYGGDGPDGEPVPIMTVFRRWPDGVVRLHWASELIHEPPDPDQDPRHLGTVEPLWTLFDLTPSGRPVADEQMDYQCCQGRNRP